MLDKEAMKLFGRHIRTTMPISSTAPLPSDLLRLVEALKEAEESTGERRSPTGRSLKAA